jgi:CheY-like chemotaxis protein
VAKSKKRILLVDDSNTVLMMHRMMLQEDYELIIARNGREGIEKTATSKPDLIFMDVVMPEMNGFEACKHLKSKPETRDIPVVMVTTRGEAVNVEAGYAAGCNDYVTKPFDPTELMTKLKNLLGEK